MKKVKIGIVGLGRLGKEHAKNLNFKIRNCEVIAACSIIDSELEYTKKKLDISNLFSEYTKMLQEMKGKMNAVFLVTSTSMHAQQIIKALEMGYHVFCEKPLAITIEDCEKVEKVARKCPSQVCQIGFVRRYDPHYSDAKRRIEAGEIGNPFLVRAQSGDKNEWAEFQIDFCKTSGGIFLDLSIHDIDLTRWFLCKNFKSVYAIGGSYLHKGFDKFQDGDNVCILSIMEDETMSYITATRTQFHGHATYGEIIGTKGTLQVGTNPRSSEVKILDKYGIRNECVQTFFDRFEQAFLLEAQDFIDCILYKKQPKISLQDAKEATKVALAMTQSYKEKRIIKL